MRAAIRLILLCFGCIFTHLVHAQQTQVALITLNKKNITFDEFLLHAEAQTNVEIVVDTNLVFFKQIQPFDLRVRNKSLLKVIEDITKKYDLDYKRIDNTIVVYKKDSRKGKAFIIEGFVKDSLSKQPIKFTQITNLLNGKVYKVPKNGRFKLPLYSGIGYLELNRWGYEKFRKRLSVYSDTSLNIYLKPIPAEQIKSSFLPHFGKLYQTNNQNEYILNNQNANLVYTNSGALDFAEQIKMMPGVDVIHPFYNSYAVRGSVHFQNQIRVNGVALLFPNSLLSPNIVHAAVDSASFKKEGFTDDLNNGGASALNLTLKKGNNKKWQMETGGSVGQTYFFAEGPIKRDKSSIAISQRTSLASPLISIYNRFLQGDQGSSDGFISKRKITPVLWDQTLRYDHKINSKTSLTLLQLHSWQFYKDDYFHWSRASNTGNGQRVITYQTEFLQFRNSRVLSAAEIHRKIDDYKNHKFSISSSLANFKYKRTDYEEELDSNFLTSYKDDYQSQKMHDAVFAHSYKFCKREATKSNHTIESNVTLQSTSDYASLSVRQSKVKRDERIEMPNSVWEHNVHLSSGYRYNTKKDSTSKFDIGLSLAATISKNAIYIYPLPSIGYSTWINPKLKVKFNIDVTQLHRQMLTVVDFNYLGEGVLQTSEAQAPLRMHQIQGSTIYQINKQIQWQSGLYGKYTTGEIFPLVGNIARAENGIQSADYLHNGQTRVIGLEQSLKWFKNRFSALFTYHGKIAQMKFDALGKNWFKARYNQLHEVTAGVTVNRPPSRRFKRAFSFNSRISSAKFGTFVNQAHQLTSVNGDKILGTQVLSANPIQGSKFNIDYHLDLLFRLSRVKGRTSRNLGIGIRLLLPHARQTDLAGLSKRGEEDNVIEQVNFNPNQIDEFYNQTASNKVLNYYLPLLFHFNYAIKFIR